MKRLYVLIVLIYISSACFAQDADAKAKTDLMIIPQLSYEYLNLTEQQFHAPEEGLIFVHNDEEKLLLVQVSAKQYFMGQDNQAGHGGPYHDDTLMFVKKVKPHLFMALLDTGSNEPVYGGLRTFEVGLGYGYELIHNDHHSLTLGGALAVTDTGIEYGDGKTWPVMLYPVIQYEFESWFFDLKFEFITDPELSFTLLPKEKIRFSAEFGIDEFEGWRDFLFDCTLWYRFFDEDSVRGDFAGLGLGIKNSSIGFDFGEKNKSYELQYYTAYGTLDLSFLQMIGGYVFEGMETFDENLRRNAGGGFFVSVQLMYAF
ncbi:MAG: hypothetical protein LBU17_12940 [Treponema sp.]|jgi:hypothetical protein|nr:hypothetical protein [Treponema sp.]